MSTSLNGTAGKFDHIQLGRDFRDFVKPRLKALPGWADYRTAQGWGGRTQSLTRAEIIAACEALGFDLVAANAEFIAQTAAGVIASMPGRTPVDIEAALDAKLAENVDDEALDAMAHIDASTPGDDAERFEGQDVETVIADVLAPASVHMTPHLASMLPGLIRPAIEAAVRGPRTVIKTIVQEAGAPTDAAIMGEALAVTVTPVKALRSVPLWRAFECTRSAALPAHKWAWENLMVDICDHVDPLNPIDADYVWQPSLLAELAAQDASNLNAWIWGPAGGGKTEGAAQYAARLGRPFVRIAIERTTEPSELIGQMVPARGGGMTWEDGKLTRAMRIPRCVVLIDEPTLLRSGTLSVLQTALDKRTVWLASGEVVKAAPGVFFIAADNTNGTGDDTGRYVDTAAVNAAFLDRFALKTEVSFLSPALEAGMISRRAGIPVAAAKIMVDYAGVTRANADSGKLTMGVTTRRLLVWAQTTRNGILSARAFNSTVIAGAASEDKATLEMLEGTTLRSLHPQIDGIVRGTIDPNAPIADPKAQGGIGTTALQFPDDNDTL